MATETPTPNDVTIVQYGNADRGEVRKERYETSTGDKGVHYQTDNNGPMNLITCANGQVIEGKVAKEAFDAVRSTGTESWGSWAGVADENYEFKTPNPISAACDAAAVKKDEGKGR